jgi:hypothetical protein
MTVLFAAAATVVRSLAGTGLLEALAMWAHHTGLWLGCRRRVR